MAGRLNLVKEKIQESFCCHRAGAEKNQSRCSRQVPIASFLVEFVHEPVWDSAHEEHISFLGLGHYATETVGPQALATYIQGTFALRSIFIKNNKTLFNLSSF